MRRNRLVLIGFCAVLAFAWFCYQPAISGAFQFDDNLNLSGLVKVEDRQSAIDFIFSGVAGPTGRPLALASFALQAEQWEQGASAFLLANILIHLINAALLALCLYQLSLQGGVPRNDAAIAAAVAASLWVLMPLLATASLFVVQRMTTLAALFMLLGLNAYLFARAKVADNPKRALAGMSASLVAGTVLATLCKESGLLLPVLVLVLEATVLHQPDGVKARYWRVWQSVFLVLPLLLLLGYLASRINYPDSMIASRDFNAWQRLLTESQILWVYLLKALVGMPSQLGIYQDMPTVSRSLFSPATFLACLSWLTLLVASIVWRRRYPLFALAVLWYLAGHLIESTVVPLELYFEHRNYIPIIGPLFALGGFLFLNPPRGQVVGVLVLVFAICNAWFLYSFASLSGAPSFAARYWAATYPGSQRAVSTMARFQAIEEGPVRAIETIDKFVSEQPQYAYTRITQLNLLCKLAPDQDHRKVVEQLERELPKVDFTYTAAVMLFELYSNAAGSTCKGVKIETVASLALTLLDNPRYTNDPIFNRSYQKMLAAIARQQGDYDAEVDHLQQAIRHRPSLDLNVLMVMALSGAGEFDAARDFVDKARARGPVHPVKAAKWRRDLVVLLEYVRRIEKNKQTTPSG